MCGDAKPDEDTFVQIGTQATLGRDVTTEPLAIVHGDRSSTQDAPVAMTQPFGKAEKRLPVFVAFPTSHS